MNDIPKTITGAITEIPNDKKPDWINVSNFIKQLNCTDTQNDIAAKIAKHYPPEQPGYDRNPLACEQLSQRWFPLFLKGLRVFEIGDTAYWLVSFCGVLIFLFSEVMLLMSYKLSFSRLIEYISYPILFILILYCLYMVIFFAFKLENKIKWKFFLDHFYTIPVIIVSLGLIVLHLMLITKSGWVHSPLLPAYVFVNLTIITAPRENSTTIIFLTVFATLMIFMPFCPDFLWNPSLKVSEGDQMHFERLSRDINLLTLCFSILIVFLARFVSSKKIIKKNSKDEK